MLRSLLLIVAIATLCQAQQQVAFEWNYLNFSWPSVKVYESAISDGSYIPKNTIITGIKVYKDKVYLTLPRWQKGVPATLTVLSKNADKTSSLLEPYPNWKMQTLDDCSAFQYVQSMEIDPKGRMWVIENGRTEFRSGSTRNKCPARLVILDIEDNGKILLDYEFPKNVINEKSVFLNDLVLDHEDGGYAYITDHDSKDPGIVVFSLKDHNAWKVRDQGSMTPQVDACEFEYDGNVKWIEGPVDGIALSAASNEGNRTLYYCPLSSYQVFSIPVNVLKDQQLSQDIDKYVNLVGNKSSQTDGMMIDNKGLLYFGLLTEDAVAYYDTNSNENLMDNQNFMYQDKVTNNWPDTFAMDDEGWLWWVPNSLLSAENQSKDDIKYRVIRMKTGSNKSYQFYEDGSYPGISVMG